MRGAWAPAAMVLVALPFAAYATIFGLRGLTLDLSAETYLFARDALTANAAMALHMLAGGLLTLLVPLQLIPRWRGRRGHRIAGRVFVAAGLIAGVGGLVFIAHRGTIGGLIMSAGFTIYGILITLAAVLTLRAARTGDVASHRAWALRFVTLAMGSLLFRLHYVLWFIAADGLGSTEDLRGPFDRIQVFAFYLPYLAALELWLRRSSRTQA